MSNKKFTGRGVIPQIRKPQPRKPLPISPWVGITVRQRLIISGALLPADDQERQIVQSMKEFIK